MFVHILVDVNFISLKKKEKSFGEEKKSFIWKMQTVGFYKVETRLPAQY